MAPNAPYVHCAKHEVNLVFNDSVKNVEEIRDFYDFVEKLYTFFRQSIKRWALLRDKVKKSKCLTLERLNPTRWSSRRDTIEALRFRFTDILKTSSHIILTSSKKYERDKATFLRNKLETFKTSFPIVLESKILKIINCVSKELQIQQQDIQNAAKMLNDAYISVHSLRKDFESLKSTAVDLAENWKCSTAFSRKRKRRPKRHFNEFSQHHHIESD